MLISDISRLAGWLQAGLSGLGVYGLVALAFGLIYALVLQGRLEPAAKSSPILFRLLIVPAAALLFPFLLLRLMFRPAAAR
jgi:hypothetical protein